MEFFQGLATDGRMKRSAQLLRVGSLFEGLPQAGRY